MSAAEIVHRARYMAWLTIERRQHAAGRLAPPGRLKDALAPCFGESDWERQVITSRRQHRTRFFQSIGAPNTMCSLFASAYARERDASFAHAARARQKQFEFFGQEFTYGHQIDWQRDPSAAGTGPPCITPTSRVHGGDVGFGDVDVWELSRQQFLIDLGKSWFLGRTGTTRALIEALVRSWIAGNPYGTGVNWPARSSRPSARSRGCGPTTWLDRQASTTSSTSSGCSAFSRPRPVPRAASSSLHRARTTI